MWFVLSLIVGLTFAANRLIIRAVFTKYQSPMMFGAVHEIIAGLLLLPIGLYYFSLPQSPQIWIALLSGLFLIFLTDFFSFLSLRNLETSLYQIINQLRHVIVLITAYFLFTEQITFIKIISIALITFGIVVALKGKSKIEINKSTIYAFLATICISFGLLFIKMASVDVSPAFSASLGFIISGVLIYLFAKVREKPVHLLPNILHKELFISAGLFAVFELCLFAALAIGEASKVIPVTQSSMIFTLVGGYVFLNERTQIIQKVIGCTLIAVGIILLYFI